MTRTAARPGVLLIAAAAVVALLVVQRGGAGADHATYTEAVVRLQHLAAQDARQNELVLQTRFGFLRNYDELVRSLDESAALVGELEASRIVFGGDLEAVQHELDRLRQACGEKRERIEEFKSANAALVNATRYFPAALGDALGAAVSGASRETIETLIEDAVRFAFEGGDELETDIAAIASPADEHGSTELDAMVAHTRRLGVSRENVDALLDSILHDPTAARLDRLDQLVRHGYGVEVARTGRQRTALYLLATALLAYGVWSFSSLRRARQGLLESNLHLEERIADRTRALNDRNSELEHEVELRARAEETLVRRNQELDEFTYVASHDLQEPLRKLMSFSQMLQKDLDGDLPPRAAEDLGYITDAASRMQRLVQDLLALSRAGKKAMKVEQVDARECVDAALVSLAGRLEECGGRVDVGELPVVHADVTMLTQLFQNLIGNGLKFARPGEAPRVEVTSDPGEEFVTFRVTDNGIGIRAEFAAKIFVPFKRLHGRGKYEGSGIGLSICAKTVERHAGRIWMESEPGAGSTFFFTLPNERPQEGTDDDDGHGADGYRLAG